MNNFRINGIDADCLLRHGKFPVANVGDRSDVVGYSSKTGSFHNGDCKVLNLGNGVYAIENNNKYREFLQEIALESDEVLLIGADKPSHLTKWIRKYYSSEFIDTITCTGNFEPIHGSNTVLIPLYNMSGVRYGLLHISRYNELEIKFRKTKFGRLLIAANESMILLKNSGIDIWHVTDAEQYLKNHGSADLLKMIDACEKHSLDYLGFGFQMFTCKEQAALILKEAF